MSLWRIEWKELITPPVIVSIAQAANVPETVVEENKERLARIFQNMNGSDVLEDQFSGNRASELALSMLGDAALFGLKSLCVRWQQSGFYEEDANSERIDKVLIGAAKVDANSASEQALKDLPIIGSVLAERIVVDREENGPFVSIQDLAERVDGLGQHAVNKLNGILTFSTDDSPGIHWEFPEGGAEQFGLFCDLQQDSGTSEERFQSALLWLATHTATDVPAGAGMHARLSSSTEQQEHPANVVGVLWGGEYYYKMLDLINAAEHSIRVAMFHIASAGSNHPSRDILDALIAAKARGVDVFVLLDNDRRTDPYKSTVINAGAITILTNGGVSVRVDKPEKLLHSKVVLVDDNICVIGSHNWTAGSYFQFDDLSFVIVSTEASVRMRQRYNELWDEGIVPE